MAPRWATNVSPAPSEVTGAKPVVEAGPTALEPAVNEAQASTAAFCAFAASLG